ncbi:hypothetical protein M8C21_019811 [Ambrosia artemisiifolia]|uniref:SLC26A/SulP transporter domain-containing protein n=1 Tax=Ambrosia artemisiifolia TaxID=4212 RepID=A0AAD5BSE7_AMBAR|nr:hypothetical protein M8C21_019811 [Ambrosia artemisiifolia]
MSGAAIIVSLQQLKALLGSTHFTKEMGLVPVMSSVFHNTKEVFFSVFSDRCLPRTETNIVAICSSPPPLRLRCPFGFLGHFALLVVRDDGGRSTESTPSGMRISL